MNSLPKCVVVTGGSRGIGFGIVQRLLADGYRVITCSRQPSPNLDELTSQYPECFCWLPCEVGDEKSEAEFSKLAFEKSKNLQLWGLVNNAGIAGEGVLATFPTVDIDRIIDINLIGPLRLSRLFLRRMLASQGGGRIVNISSIIGSRGYTGLATYAVSKAGLDGMTRALAREVGRLQITVNSVAPGFIRTELSSSLGADQLNQIVRRTPMGILAEVEDIAAAVAFLMSPEARLITGQTLTIDGGISC